MSYIDLIRNMKNDLYDIIAHLKQVWALKNSEENFTSAYEQKVKEFDGQKSECLLQIDSDLKKIKKEITQIKDKVDPYVDY